MTPQENRQRQVEAMYAERERRDHEREHGLEPQLFVEEIDPGFGRVPVIKRIPEYESFTVRVVEVMDGRRCLHKLTVLANDRDYADWAALRFFSGKNLCYVQNL